MRPSSLLPGVFAGLGLALSFLAACSDQTASRAIRLDGNTNDCTNVEEICLQTEPLQCFDYCADVPPVDAPNCPDVPGPGEVEPNTTGPVGCDDPCIIVGDIDGNEVQLCGDTDDGCVIVYDVETGEETIACDDPNGPGENQPGDPGTGTGENEPPGGSN